MGRPARAGGWLRRCRINGVIKTVGTRRIEGGEVGVLQRTLAAIRATGAIVPRGVYRFQTFEEADAWMTRTMARTHASLKSKISPASARR
jgi:hypothetical protein